MIYFINDYSEGAHERILNKLAETNRMQTPGYGMDDFCAEARQRIMERLDHPESQVHFLVGGTQTNMTVISSILRPHQGVIAAASGHVSVHESGAIESTGHKVLALPSDDGKIRAAQIEAVLRAHYDDETQEHMVQPAMVYISQSTELGTVYSRQELTAIHELCQKYQIPLFVDGARLGNALAAVGYDLTLADMARLTDVFYIGGTKNGALFGEAVVINNPMYQKDFRYMIKQKGGMFAKGRLLGIQFDELFRDDLYFELADHANRMAQKMAAGIREKGYSFGYDSPTNQIFPIFPDSLLEEIAHDYAYSYWQRIDPETSLIRLCTSWATPESVVDTFLAALPSA